MQGSSHGVREKLGQIRDFLDQGSFLSFSQEEREELLDRSGKLQRKLDSFVESRLTVGLLGGTGVGKSTLMNALAGREIASTSHRRPHTDRVLIYRHKDAELPPNLERALVISVDADRTRGDGSSHPDSDPGQEYLYREFTHSIDSIDGILLCDLPDFDSLAGEHRQRVIHFLEHLDVLVWVVSPEKYADGKFYSFLHEVPKARQNFYFVLNKVDILFQGKDMETGYDRLSKVTSRFQQHLEENGIERPLIYPVSAADAFHSIDTAPWNAFGAFRDAIFQDRDSKEITAIKAANLDIEVERLIAELEREFMFLKAFHGVLSDFIDYLKHTVSELRQSGKTVINLWLDQNERIGTLSRQPDASSLVGAGYLIATTAQEWRRFGRMANADGGEEGILYNTAQLSPLKQSLENLEDRLVNTLSRSGLPKSYLNRTVEVIDAGGRWARLQDKFRRSFEVGLEIRVSRPSRIFRLYQYLTYVAVTVAFLAALAGDAGWRAFMDDPGWSGVVMLFAAMVVNIFNPVGLAALMSYLLLNLFFGFRFYGRYKKFLQRSTQKFIESLKIEISRVWGDELDALIRDLEDYRDKVAAQTSASSSLYAS